MTYLEKVRNTHYEAFQAVKVRPLCVFRSVDYIYLRKAQRRMETCFCSRQCRKVYLLLIC